jgi:pyroglutamyl-peptidase
MITRNQITQPSFGVTHRWLTNHREKTLHIPTLLFGFEPFGGHSRNPSAELVAHIASLPKHRERLAAYVLPVSASRVTPRVEELIARHTPTNIIAFGLGGGDAIEIERVGVNLCDFRIPDADGEQRIDIPVVQEGPPAYFSTLPTREFCVALDEAGIPVGHSLSAGAYLCNYLLYSLLHLSATRSHTFRTCFVHLPLLPEMSQAEPSMPFEQMVQAAELILQRL